MKKNFKVAVIGLCAAVMMAGCGNKQNTEDTTTTSTSDSTEVTTTTGETTTEPSTTQEQQETATYTRKSDYSEFVTLGQYKGIEVEFTSITDEDVEERIRTTFRDTVQEGDTVNIDYEGLLDGVAFDGGTAKGASLKIGSNSFIEGFEEKLIGAKIGETKNLDLAFPDPYTRNPDLAGKAVVFIVTVNGIDGIEGAELNEEFVKNNTDFASVDEYKENLKKTLESEKENETLTAIWKVVRENATVNDYPQEEVTFYTTQMKDYYSQIAGLYGVDLAGFLASMQMDEASFNTECETYAKSTVEEMMILTEIARLENIIVDDEEYKAEIAKTLEGTENTEQDLLDYYGGEEGLRETMTFNKVFKFLLDNSAPV